MPLLRVVFEPQEMFTEIVGVVLEASGTLGVAGCWFQQVFLLMSCHEAGTAFFGLLFFCCVLGFFCFLWIGSWLLALVLLLPEPCIVSFGVFPLAFCLYF